MNITINTDGGSLNNPGEAAYAYVIYTDGTVFEQKGERLGIATNNVAEYNGLLHALLRIKELLSNKTLKDIKLVQVFADSELMIRQVNGIYKVKHADMRVLYDQVKVVEKEIGIPITYTHVLRDKNALADSLVKKALGR
ncbi:MAG: ribonuclease HI family protein [Candidatus Roizmanbacteria bacterium]